MADRIQYLKRATMELIGDIIYVVGGIACALTIAWLLTFAIY